MDRIKEKLWREIDGIAEKPEMSHGDLETLGKLVDALKDIAEICAMEDYGDGGYSGARHYVRAHYSRAGMPRDSYAPRRDGRGRYAGAGDDMRRHLEAAMATAGAEDREMLERMLDKL